MEQWLLLCKLLAYAKKHSDFLSKPNIHNLVQNNDIDILDMFLDKLINKYEYQSWNTLTEKCPIEVDIVGWENVLGSSMELGSTYSLYNIRYTTTLAHFTRTDWNIQRRYSDFSFLVEALARRYPGALIPPLPPKFDHFLDTNYHTSQNKIDHVAKSRANDLSIFLKHSTQHPVLSQSLEMMIFLQASTQGFASYRSAIEKVLVMHQEVSNTDINNCLKFTAVINCVVRTCTTENCSFAFFDR